MSFEEISGSFTPKETKSERYLKIRSTIPAFFSSGVPAFSAANNFIALLHEAMGNLWTGFYFVDTPEKKEPTLHLGFFQGSAACDTILYGRGVCGTALKEAETQVVRDVALYPGHIACSSASKSEIVLPLKDEKGRVIGVLDMDSDEIGAYDNVDRSALEEIVSDLAPKLSVVYRTLSPLFSPQDE